MMEDLGIIWGRGDDGLSREYTVVFLTASNFL